tara:strand:+ start:2130 stop:2732 length:603 start_codon:yes stop_codon:yes gene_type:complete
MAYLGREPAYGAFERQSLTPDGSTTTFTLTYTVASTSSILVSVAGVLQEPNSAYTLANGGTQIAFTAAPEAGTTVFLIYLGIAYEGAIVGQTSFTSFNELNAQAADDDRLLIYDLSAQEVKFIQKSNIATVVTFTTDKTNTGDGSTTAFTINSGRSVDDILVIVNGITLTPTDDYTVSGTTLTFVAAPAASAEIVIRYLG